jgi:broad specificity phosphatase PhoE
VTVEIVFETHSMSEDNERGIATGWLDGRLSETGRRLARELGERRLDERIDAVFTSDLGRALETSGIAFGNWGIPVHTDSRLRECSYGSLNGASVDEIEAQRRRCINDPFPGGESYKDVVARVQDFLTDLARDWDGKRVVVIGHAATRWALDHLLLGAALEDLVSTPFEWQNGWRYTVP